jgi:hypothetical protein
MLNTSVTRKITFLYFAALVGALFAHYPFDGYADTVYVQAATRLPKWNSDRPACGKVEEAQWHRYYDWVLSTWEEKAKLAIPSEQLLRLGKIAQVLDTRCVTLEVISPEREDPKSFLEWRSVGALVRWLQTGMNLVVAVASISAIAVAAFLLLGDRGRPQ